MNNIVIDRLTLCYRISKPEILRDIITKKDEEKPKEISFDDEFKLYITKRKGFKSAYNITYNDIVMDEDDKCMTKQYLFGVLKYGQLDGYDDDADIDNKLVWLEIHNSTFYFRYNQKASKLVYLSYITEHLGLALNNVTHIDIAADSSVFNFAKAIKSLLRCEDLVPIVVNRAYEDRTITIPHIQFFYGTSCKKLLNDFSIYIQQKGNGDTIVLNSYNKKNELEDTDEKDYISEYYNYPKKLHRLELRLHRKQFQQFLENNNIHLEENLFLDAQFLYNIYETYLTKLIRFRMKNNSREVMNLFEASQWLDKLKKRIRTQKRHLKLQNHNNN